MAGGEVLKEFLVALGFQVDDNSFNKFESSLGKATSGAVQLGEVVVASALAIEGAVAKMASQFEALFYQSQRTGSAVRAIQGFEYAARTVGVSSDQAKSAVEGLARAMRSNPGIGALLNQLGVKTAGRGSVEILGDVIGQLKKMPFYLAQSYGQTLGIDGDTLKMLIDRYGELRAAQVDYEKRQKDAGVDAKKLSEDSRGFSNALRSLETTLGLIADRILQDFIGPATKAVQLADEWARSFIEIDKATNGWATTLATIGTTALAAWIGKMLLAKVLFRQVATEAAAAAAGPAAAGAAGAATAGAGLSTLGVLARGGVVGAAVGTLGLMKYDDAHGNGVRSWLRKKLGIRDTDAPERRDSIVKFFMDQGWSKAQAVGIAANLHRESGFDEKSTGDGGQAAGIAQWHPDRQKNFEKLFGHGVREGTLEEQLKFVQYELTLGSERAAGNMLRQAGSPEEAAAAVSKFYERPADKEGEAAGRGGLARKWFDAPVAPAQNGGGDVSQNVTNNFNVKSTDPKAAAKEISGKQDDVNANMVRYSGATVR